MKENEAMATAHRARMHALVGDLFAPPALRLTDRERALMKGALAALVRTAIREIRHQLEPGYSQISSDAARDEALAWTIVEHGTALRTVPVAELLRLRVDLHALSMGLADAMAPLAADRPLPAGSRLLSADNPAGRQIADLYCQVTAVRRDGFDSPVLVPADLPPAEARALCWSVLAALHTEVPRRIQPLAHNAMPPLVERWVQARDTAPRYEQVCAAVVQLGNWDDMTALSLELLSQGAADLWLYALAKQMDVSARAICRLLTCRRLDLLAILLPGAGVEPPVAQKIIAVSASILAGPESYYSRKPPQTPADVDLRAVLEVLRAEPDFTDASLEYLGAPMG